MYIKLDEELYKKVQKITLTDYKMTGNFMPADSIVPMLEDMLTEYGVLEEKLNDLRQEISENYEIKKTNMYEEYGVSQNDFL